MSKKSKQWYWLTDAQLGWLTAKAGYENAQEEWEKVQEVKKAGHKVAIYYSEFNGFRVIDEDDPNEFKIGLSISKQARPFRM